jgi:hypothetical protein
VAQTGGRWGLRGPVGGAQNTNGCGNLHLNLRNGQEQAGEAYAKPMSSKPSAYQTTSEMRADQTFQVQGFDQVMEGNTIPVRVKSGNPSRIANNGFGFINAGNPFTNPKVTRHYGPGSERFAQQYELQSGVDTNPYEAPSKSQTVSNQEESRNHSMEPPTVESRTDEGRSPGSARRPSYKPASEKPALEAVRVQDLQTRPLPQAGDAGQNTTAPNTERRRLMRYEEHAIQRLLESSKSSARTQRSAILSKKQGTTYLPTPVEPICITHTGSVIQKDYVAQIRTI